ncbi:MAG TPA: VCBS repeat-containing protein [Bacteroidia bacterium]|jgi:hypothetical protein|nr:VCBS repeat-containing protein [Bacteroidia bacterium]
MKKTVFSIVFIVSFGLLNAQSCFTTFSTYSTGINPQGVLLKDLNSDGKADMVVSIASGTSTHLVSVYLNNGSGAYTTHVDYTVDAIPIGIASADFNGDGKPDLAVACSGNTANDVSILLNAGAGTFSTAVNYTVGSSGPTCVVTADFNNDTKIDIAVSNQNSSNISVLFGTGTGAFGSPATYATGSNITGLATADFNGDGFYDVATSNYNTSSSVSVLLNTGTGTFTTAVSYSSGGLKCAAITTGDFNGDSKTDLAIANRGSSGAVLLGTGSGTFGSPISYPTSANPNSIVATDINSDGKTDLATANLTGGNVSILMGDGTGNFNVSTSLNAGSDPVWISAGDVNGDSKPDLAVVNLLSNDAYVYLNSATTTTITGVPYKSFYCYGDSVLLNAGGSINYNWSTGSANNTYYMLSSSLSFVFSALSSLSVFS